MRRLGLSVVVGMSVTVAAPMPAAAAPQAALEIEARFASCAPPAGQTWTYDRLNCLYIIGRQQGLLAEAQGLLRRLGAEDPDRPWPTLILGYTMHQQDQARALQLYQLAAEGFVRAHDAEGEVIARHNLRTLHWLHGRVKEATQEVARAVAAAEASQHRIAMARAAVLEANHLIETGGDLGRAYRTLMRAQPAAFPNGPIGLRRALLLVLANTCTYLGRLDEAIDALERHRRLRQEDGSLSEAAMVAFNLLNARLTKNEMHPVGAARERLTLEAEDVLAEAQRLERPMYIAHTHRVLADLLRATDPAAAGMHIARCVELATSLKYPGLRAACLWSQSRYEATRDRARAEDASRQALAELANNPSGPLVAYAWQARMRLVWQTAIGEEEEEQAIAASIEALDAIERLRGAQKDESSRAVMFSNWTGDYRYLTGRLLSARTRTSQLSRAFEVGERLRARVLLEHLTRAGVTPDAAAPFASLANVQHALAEDEALLWFVIAPWVDMYGEFGGGSWVIAIRRDAATVHRLTAGVELESQVAALVGLLRDRDVSPERWEKATERLGQVLVGEAIAELPPSVRRLVIVSDGELHRLPFEVLRPTYDRPRLGERFEIAIAPSATLWLHLRQRQQTMMPAPAVNSALVLADPDLPRGAIGDQRLERLERLPWARREARAIADALQLDAGRVREGSAASEQFLKHAPLASASVLHLAAHARADETLPDRSAIFLAPGAASADGAAEDGWLQPREIAALGLQGQLVVLSACDSAGGFLLSGEGPLSLARAFFAGGAGVVVATRWPLRDDDAAFVMERFYRALASGATVGAALHTARREAIDARRPAAAWAGLVLLGDGLRAPFTPPPQPEPFVTSFAIEAAVAIGVIIVLISFATRSHARVDARREG